MSFAEPASSDAFAFLSRLRRPARAPGERRLSLIVVAGGALIVAFISALAALMVRQIDESSRKAEAQHVSQLHKAVVYQLGTMMVGIEQSMRHAGDAIRDANNPLKLLELAADGRVSLHLLRDMLFIDNGGRVVVSSMRPHELASMSNRGDREYFTIHLDRTRAGTRIGRPITGRRTGLELIPVSHAVYDATNNLMGVLVAFVDIRALETIWVEIGLTSRDRIDLIGEDGSPWFSWPHGDRPEPAKGTMSWSHPIAGWPMKVVATLEQASIDQHAAGTKQAIVMAAAGGSLMIALFCLLLANRQAAAEAVKARLLATIEAIPVEFMEYDRDGRLILINEAARLTHGWTHAAMGKTQRQLLEESLAERRALYPDQDWDTWMRQRIATSERLGTFELTRPSGETGRFFVKDMPGGGRVVLRVDITESKQREAELLATQDRYRRLFDTIPYPLVVVTVETRRILTANAAALEFYGWSHEELLAMSMDDFYRPEDLPKVRSERRQTGQGGIKTVRDLQHRKKDGTIVDVEMQTRSIEYNGTAAIMIMCQDLTEALRSERARQLAEDQLRQSQKMESVGQLTGGIAHDFNNILTVILANADALQEDGVDAEQLPQRLRHISEAVHRASDLTRQLLAFSRKQALDPKPTDLNELVMATGKLLRRSLGEHIEINSALAGSLWTVKVDRTQLETAIVNLCVNARDAMPGGGKITIKTRNVVLTESDVAGADGVAPGQYAMVAVTDTGTGMPPEVQAKIFEPFYTTKEVGKGTGLGLSMVYGFIRQSNGHIKVESDVGRGTTFRLYLPRSAEAREEATVHQAPALPRGSERILVVEDEPLVRAAVVSQLASLGYAVTASENGEAGVAACEAATQPFDLLLTDVVMPGALNGKATADEVTRRSPTTKVVFMSGYAESAIVHDGTLDQGVRLLRKPFRKAELAQILREVLDRPAVQPV